MLTILTRIQLACSRTLHLIWFSKISIMVLHLFNFGLYYDIAFDLMYYDITFDLIWLMKIYVLWYCFCLKLLLHVNKWHFLAWRKCPYQFQSKLWLLSSLQMVIKAPWACFPSNYCMSLCFLVKLFIINKVYTKGTWLEF